MDITVASNYHGEAFTVSGNNSYINKEYLKSHLQKVIRRSNPYKALKTAWHFLDLDISDFLRRLAIIALEDCLPLEGFANVVWFMAAISKGYHISNEQICWILGYVYDLALCTRYEQINHDPQLQMRNIRMRTLDGDGKNLVYSIALRRSFGGMRGDKDMCLNAAKLWSARYNTKSLLLPLLKRDLKFITPPTAEMRKSEWVVGAIDFHCCPNIVTAMWEKHDEFTEDQIRQAIWHCSSSVTHKENIGEELAQRTPQRYLDIWKVIKKDFLSYARFLLEKNG